MRVIGSALLFTTFLLTSAPLSASSLQVLHSFHIADGDLPGPIIKRGESLYGTTSVGGPNSDGVVFRMDPKTGSESTIGTFEHLYYEYDVGGPRDGLVDSGGTLYGTTQGGGTGYSGTLFSIGLATGIQATVHNFYFEDGKTPQGGLVEASAKVLYGVTRDGGTHFGGNIFKFLAESGDVKSVYDFSGPVDGCYPSAGLLFYQDDLYGTTNQCGLYGYGGIFKFHPATKKLTSLHSFGETGDANGVYPQRNILVAYNNAVYGTIDNGGPARAGLIYKIDLATGVYSDVYDFRGGADGAKPLAGLTVFDGALYGVTAAGGRHNNGALFKFDPATRIETVLYKFSGPDGSQPQAELYASPVALYGTTITGGAYGFGTVFKFVP